MDNEVLSTARELRTLKDTKKDLEEQLKGVNNSIDSKEFELVMQMTNEELDKFSLDGTTFYLQDAPYVKAVPEFKKKLFSWLKRNGFKELVQETVNANTLRATVKNMLEEGDGNLPKGLVGVVEITPHTKIGMRRG